MEKEKRKKKKNSFVKLNKKENKGKRFTYFEREKKIKKYNR